MRHKTFPVCGGTHSRSAIMNMYRCKTEVDLCLYGRNGIEKEVERGVRSASSDRGREAKLQRPKWHRSNLPVSNGAARFIRLVNSP